MDGIKADASAENIYNQFGVVAGSIQDMIHGGISDSSRHYNLESLEGSLSIDSERDRFIVMCSFDSDYDFVVIVLVEDGYSPDDVVVSLDSDGDEGLL